MMRNSTTITFMVDDGTGMIDCRVYLGRGDDPKIQTDQLISTYQSIHPHSYVQVIGRIYQRESGGAAGSSSSSWQPDGITVYNIRVVQDHNELLSHFFSVIHRYVLLHKRHLEPLRSPPVIPTPRQQPQQQAYFPKYMKKPVKAEPTMMDNWMIPNNSDGDTDQQQYTRSMTQQQHMIRSTGLSTTPQQQRFQRRQALPQYTQQNPQSFNSSPREY